MDVLRFTDDAGRVAVTIATRSIHNPLRRLKSRVGDEAAMHYCDYRSSVDGELLLEGTDPLPRGRQWEGLPPVMFETCQYNITLKFKDIEGTPRIVHANKDVAESFQWYPADGGGFLMTALDFLNEPGIFRLHYAYKPQGLPERADWLEFRIVSPKLDTKRDLMHMMSMINAEYENLVFKYLTKTFQSLSLSGGKSNHLIWLSIFKSVIDEYVTALEYVTNRPNMRGERTVHYDKADRMKRWTPRLLNQYEEQKAANNLGRHLFCHDETRKTVDTRENRFVKYTVVQTGKKLTEVLKQLRRDYDGQLLGDEMEWLDAQGVRLEHIMRHRLWRQIGEFGGFRQESSVLQKRTGYSQIYRLWYILQSGIGFFEGSNEIGVRPIWELYELWCFLKMKQLVLACLEIDLSVPEQAALVEEDPKTMLSPFSDSTVEHVLTCRNRFNGDTVQLRYQHTYNRRSGEMHTATTEQRPDIVLDIRKADGFVLTYLYDAKYRVLDDTNKDVFNLEKDYDVSDYPPPDALKQMHRYRDAIYYGSDRYRHAAKEIIGGYILFPGRYHKDEGSAKPYYIESIRNVNIGAFPLLPDGEHPEKEGEQLRLHLRQILRTEEAYDQIKDSIPQKGLRYEQDIPASPFLLIGFVAPKNLPVARSKGLYYVRAFKEGQSFKLLDHLDKVEYLLLHSDGEERSVRKVEGNLEFISGAGLRDKGFDTDGADTDMYLLIHFDKDSLPEVPFDVDKVNLGSKGNKTYFLPKVRTLAHPDV